MSVDMTRSFAFIFCTTDDVTSIVVQKSRCGAESFSAGLETEYRFQIGLESWGDNKVDNNRSRVDNTAPCTTASYNPRVRSVQHPRPPFAELMSQERKAI